MKESLIYIGKNGSGKTTELKRLMENREHYFFIETLENPDINFSKEKGTINLKIFWDKLSNFIENLVSENGELNLDDLNDNRKKYLENLNKNKAANFDLDELNKIWTDIINNDRFESLFDKEQISPFESNNEIFIKYKINPITFDSSIFKRTKNIGTGNLAFFQIYFISKILDSLKIENNNFSLFIDEPELYLHPSLKREVGYLLRKINEKINVIISTHSAIISNYFYDLNNTKIMYKKKDNDFSELNLSNFAKNNLIGRRELFESLFSDKIMIIEGNNDLKLIEYILYKNNISKDVYVKNAKGKIDIPKIYKAFISYRKWNKEDIMIMHDIDRDKTDYEEKHKNWNKEISDLKLIESNLIGFENDLEDTLRYKGVKEEMDLFTNFSEVCKREFVKIEEKVLAFLEEKYE